MTAIDGEVREEILTGDLGRFEGLVIVSPEERHIIVSDVLTEAEQEEFIVWAREPHQSSAERTILSWEEFAAQILSPKEQVKAEK